MDNELISDILAAEGRIRQRIKAREEESSAELEALRLELEKKVEDEAAALAASGEKARCQSEEKGEKEAEAIREAAQAFAEKLEKLDNRELDRIILQHLLSILPDGAR